MRKREAPPMPSTNDRGAARRPRIALSLGDPCGVGPEVVVRALGDPRVWQACLPVLAGHPEIARRAVRLLGLPLEVREIGAPEEAVDSPRGVACVRAAADGALAAPAGAIDARGGQAAYDALQAAAAWALAGRVEAIVTAPLHKKALQAAGHAFPGHTELLAERCGVDRFAMMLYLASGPRVFGPAGLGVAHVTLHMALRDVFGCLDPVAIADTAQLLDGMMRRLGAPAPRLGVAALNPHAGDSGLFGDEEPRVIVPAVAEARRRGIDAAGPLPVDTLFVQAAAGAFDGVVALYHDQGHIALKLLGMLQAVNVTLGLPIVRTSPAHGTAFDIAWQGKADPAGMIEAIRVAAQLACVPE